MTDKTQSPSDALAPCPFCGAAAHFEKDAGQWEWIECESCGMQGNRGASLMEDCKPMLREAWNRRTPAAGEPVARQCCSGGPRWGHAWSCPRQPDAPAPQPPAKAPTSEQAGDTEVLRERDEAEEFIDVLLDEVLGSDRPEWSNVYGRIEALQDVQERITALQAPAVDRAWERFQATVQQTPACLEVGAAGAAPPDARAQAVPSDARLAANTDLLTYVLQDDVHNRLTPRVIDIAYSAFMQAKLPNTEDGGPSDWFNDTKPMVTEAIDKLRRDLMADRAAQKGGA